MRWNDIRGARRMPSDVPVLCVLKHEEYGIRYEVCKLVGGKVRHRNADLNKKTIGISIELKGWRVLAWCDVDEYLEPQW